MVVDRQYVARTVTRDGEIRGQDPRERRRCRAMPLLSLPRRPGTAKVTECPARNRWHYRPATAAAPTRCVRTSGLLIGIAPLEREVGGIVIPLTVTFGDHVFEDLGGALKKRQRETIRLRKLSDCPHVLELYAR